MARSNRGFKVLTLAGLVLGLVAIGVWSAQAEVGANWMVSGANLSSVLLPPVQVKEIENSDGTLLTKIAGVKVEFLCTALELIGAKLGIEGKVDPFTGKFSGCLTKLNGSVSVACEPFSHVGAVHGVTETKELKGLLVLHNGAGVTRIEPVSGQILALILMGPDCAIGDDIPIIGKLTLKDSALTTEATTHLIVEGPLTEMWAISKTEEHKATIDGSAVVTLSGAPHVGLKWSGLPA